MIQETLIVMTLLGCGNDTTSCDYISTVGTNWNSIQECNAAAPAEIRKQAAAPYPVVTANCEVITRTVSVEPEKPQLPTMFDQLRAEADTVVLDPVANLKAGVENVGNWFERSGKKIRDLFVSPSGRSAGF